MRKGIKIRVVFCGALIMGIIFYISPACSFDKEEMDAALREEIAKIDDVEMKKAMLEEYKELLVEQMPELNIEEATCVACEEDIAKLELAAAADIEETVPDSEAFADENEKLLEKETVYSTETEIVKEWVPSKCDCGGSWQDKEVTTTVATGETVTLKE